MAARVFAAVDLGASSGRVFAGVVDRSGVTLRPVHRFPNGPRFIDGHLRWDTREVYREVLVGLRKLAHEHPDVESIGIDTWGVDYGVLDADGQRLADPVAYRDPRTAPAVAVVHSRVPPDELFRINGLQSLPINTIYQLAAEQQGPLWDKAAHIVLLPDLLAFSLTGELRTEATNASTTGLVDVATGDWSRPLLDRLGIPPGMLPPIEAPGTVRGPVLGELCERLGFRRPPLVTTVGSHDTASAVAGTPLAGARGAYVSCGTWSLVGLELEHAVVTDAVRVANFTNERGVDGRVRFLRNVGGLWMVQESLRAWAERAQPVHLAKLLADAARLADNGPQIDVDDPAFVAPGDMPARVAAAVAAGGGSMAATPSAVVRCIVDSLATAYARTVDRAGALADVDVECIHVVGGGAHNELLCRLTARAARRRVVAGPVEATALGNVLVQARAHGALGGSLDDLRAAATPSLELRTYDPFEGSGVR